MEEGTKAFVKEVKALPKAVRDEDCFKVGALALSRSAQLHTYAEIRDLGPLLLVGFVSSIALITARAVCASVCAACTLLLATYICILHADRISMSLLLILNTAMTLQGLDLSVKNFLTSVPLVADLRSPAMRERHWTQLMTTTKVNNDSDAWHE